MRLTLLNQFYVPDVAPTGQLAASLARHRAARGDEVRVVTGSGGYVPESPVAAYTVTDGPRLHRIWTPGLGKAGRLRRILDYVSFFLFACVRMLTLPPQDLIISMTTPPYIAWAAILHKWIRPRCRIVLWTMDVYPEAVERLGSLREGSLVDRLLRGLSTAMMKSVDHVICLDDAMRDLLLGHYPDAFRNRPVTVIPNFEEVSQFPPFRVPTPWHIEGLRPRAESLVVLYLGNAGRGHGFDDVVHAAGSLRDQDVVFLFVGGGEKWGWIRRAAGELQLQNLHQRPYVAKEATPGIMASADCGLITLRDDALGVMSPSKLHAYLAMGLPVIYIGPEGSNVDEAVRRYECGISLRNGDAAGLVRQLRRLARDRQHLRELSLRARRAFEEGYSDRVVLPKFDQVIGSMV